MDKYTLKKLFLLKDKMDPQTHTFPHKELISQ
jgi:hypothetical protein